MAAPGRFRFGTGVALVVLCFVVYLPALHNGFVWDDEQYVLLNPAVTAGLTARGAAWSIGALYAGNWHPLTWLSHMADVSVFGLDPRGPHAVNLLLHALNTLLTYSLLRRLTGSAPVGAAVAALFAVHPLHVETVAWVSQRKTLLATTFWLAALIAWTGWTRNPRPGRYWCVVGLYCAALASKAMPVTFPLQLLLMDWWPLGRTANCRPIALVREKIPFFLLALVSCALAVAAQTRADAVLSLALMVRLQNAAIACVAYLGKAIWPARLAALYPLPTGPIPTAKWLGAAALVTAISAAVILGRRRFPATAFGWGWFLVSLLPVLGLVQVGMQSMADRYAYVPLIGLFTAVVWSARSLAERVPGSRSALVAALILALVVLTAVARAQVGTWKDPGSVFTQALRVKPDNPLVHYNLGCHLYGRQEYARAAEHFRAAIRLTQIYPAAHNNLALALERLGDFNTARSEYDESIRQNPSLAETHNNLGVLLKKTKNLEAAEERFRRALALRADFLAAQVNLGQLLASQRRFAEALPHLREAVRLSPGTAAFHQDLGLALANLGRSEEAVPAMQEALRLDPRLTAAREYLARVPAEPR